MGAWGSKSWDNDTSSDWYAELFGQTQLAEKVVAGLHADLEDDPEVVRAAANVLVQLGHVYIWPVDRLQADLTLAAERLEAIIEGDSHVVEDPDAVELIEAEIQALRSRIR